ncbi:hypothetical protein Halxa_0485 (plasmid) [Halopiger xanaduensis SH-6]|uniref:Uncharacterized protein n=1 Tax=Halopiger xanaduensis (strain DSM 18323 / JCM 14033 / SH-6) TaxID=797210 RepID=F8DDJ2_HALXS|nr:hypothetical protein Halxa_0485 [Halopiger xanaduensis SH-6]
MSDDGADRFGALYATSWGSNDRVRAVGDAVLEFTATCWHQFVRPISPVFEGAAVAVASTAVSAALTVGIDGGAIFYTLTALVIVSVYFNHRL